MVQEFRILVDDASFTPSSSKGLGDTSFVKLSAFHQVAHRHTVATRIKVLISAQANAPTFPYRCRNVGIDSLTAEHVERIVHTSFKLVTCQLRLTIDAIADDPIFQHHILWTHGSSTLMTYTTMPTFIGVQLVIIVRHRQAIFIDVGISADRQT